MNLPLDDFTPDTLSGEVVHWMAPGRVRMENRGLAALAIAAVGLGLCAYALFQWVAPRVEIRR